MIVYEMSVDGDPMFSAEIELDRYSDDELENTAINFANWCNDALTEEDCVFLGTNCPLGKKKPCSEITSKDWLGKIVKGVN